MSAPLTAERLAEIEARANAATPGPWYAEHRGVVAGACREVIDIVDDCAVSGWRDYPANQAFIAHAREDVPALVAEVRRLTAALDLARREGAEAMREALIARFKGRVEYLRSWAAEDTEDGCHTGAWTEALNAMQFTQEMALPLDAPGGEG